MKQLMLGILRETKDPPDKRVPLTPLQCQELESEFKNLKIVVQPSGYRCFSDEEYRERGITLQEDLSGCEILLGVKEVKIETLLSFKTYLFFSHTAKKQPYNRELLQTIVNKSIRLVDYEYLTRPDQVRVVAFGRWAGIVGAYNGLRALGLRSGKFDLKPAHLCRDLSELTVELSGLQLENLSIAITGGGRVAGGAVEIMEAAGVSEVAPDEYLVKDSKGALFTRLDPWHYTRRSDGSDWNFNHFISFPEMYENSFLPYARKTHMFIPCHFWDPRSPILLSRQDLTGGQVPIQIVADISCDINGPVPSTIRASTIAEPFYGYDAATGRETEPFNENSITVMAVDNLPGELPRDASEDFGKALIRQVIPELTGERNTGMIERATIADEGSLTSSYAYLKDYLEGKE
jgi:alanine dehydrogenase